MIFIRNDKNQNEYKLAEKNFLQPTERKQIKDELDN